MLKYYVRFERVARFGNNLVEAVGPFLTIQEAEAWIDHEGPEVPKATIECMWSD